MSLYNGTEQVSSQIGLTQYTDTTDLMKYMNVEVGDIGQVCIPINENENRRRYLNGQAILQTQFPKFTQKLKAAVALYPQLACTETEWQAYRTADKDDQCPKFVIDDVSGLIRLPRIKFLCGNLNLYQMSNGLSNRRIIQQKDPNDTDRSWYKIYNDGWCEQGNNTQNITEEDHWFTFEIPFLNTPHVIIGRERDSRNSVTTNTDFMGRWNCSKTGFRTWGNWNGFRMSYTACGFINLNLINNYAKSVIHTNTFESPYYIQVSTGVEYNVDVTNTITHNTPYSFGMYTRSVGNLNNASWLKSNGNYYSGTAYPDLYNWLLQNHSGARNDGIKVALQNTSYYWMSTGGDSTYHMWTARRNPKIGDAVHGYQFQHTIGYVTSIIDANTFTYNNIILGNTQTCTYDHIDENLWAADDYTYIVDTANQTFRLPLLVGDEMTPQYNNDNIIEIGTGFFPQYIRSDNRHYYVAPCNGYAVLQIDRENSSGYTPAYSVNGIQMLYGPYWVANFTNWNIPLRKGDILRVYTSDNLTSNNFEYGRRAFVKATNLAPLYFYAGETIQNANLVNVGRIIENIANIDQLAQMGQQLSQLTTRYVISKWNSGTEGYMIYNDGFCAQWGRAYGSDDGNTTVTFHKKFKDTNYNVDVCDILGQQGGGNFSFVTSHSYTTDNMMLAYQSNAGSSWTACWKATGYLAEGEY